MRLSCGRSWRLKCEQLEDWHRHFCWWPTKIGFEDCRWLEWVERRGEFVGAHEHCWWHWEYREIPRG